MSIKIPKKCVVDTNVACEANKKVSEVALNEISCVENSIDALQDLMRRGSLYIDFDGEIFSEYGIYLNIAGQPGVGHQFMKWIHTHFGMKKKVKLVQLTRQKSTYKEFPNSKGMIGFDKSDEKFVAVANAGKTKVSILEATDSKWWGYRAPLKTLGIRVIFMCPKYVEQKYARKFSHKRVGIAENE